MENNHPEAKREAAIKHRQQVTWQILAPILLAVVIFLFVGVLTILAAGKKPAVNENWAQIATIVMIVPVIFQGIILLVLIILGCWLIAKFTRFIPPHLVNFSDIVTRVATVIMNITNKTAVPFIKGRSIFAGIQKLFSLIFHASISPKE